jgi:hypothetical protein
LIHHIDVHTVLQRCVCDLYSNLVTRPTGVAVRTEIEQLLLAMSGQRTLAIIDFTNVGLLDYSCADEIVAKLLLRTATDTAAPDGYFLFRGINDAHADAIEAVLERHGLALVAQRAGDGALHLLGVLDDGERSAWEAVAGGGPLAAAELARAAGCTAAEAERLLVALHQRRLVMRLGSGYVVPGGGAQ